VELKMSALKVLLRLAPACASASAHVQVDGAGSVTVDGALWLASATPRFFCGGWRDLGPGKQRKATHGSDALGAFKEQVRTFATTDGGAGVELALKTYGDDVFVLEQRLRHGCAHTQASPVPLLPRDSVETADTNFPGMVSPFLTFPAWNSEDGDLKDLRYLTWQGGNHAIYQWTVQESHGHDITQPHSDGTFWGLAGLSSGPVVLMKEGPNRTALPSALVVGPLTNPKLATSVIPEIVWEMGSPNSPLSRRRPDARHDQMGRAGPARCQPDQPLRGHRHLQAGLLHRQWSHALWRRLGGGWPEAWGRSHLLQRDGDAERHGRSRGPGHSVQLDPDG
jgi:hypothetical protein